MRQNSFYTVINAMPTSTALLIYFVYDIVNIHLLPGDDLKNTNKPYIVTIAIPNSSVFSSENNCFHTAIAGHLSILGISFSAQEHLPASSMNEHTLHVMSV